MARPLRRLGHLESYEAVRYARGLFTNVGTSAVYSHPTASIGGDGESLKRLVLQAVSRVVAHHPALSTVFLGADNPDAKPRYAQLPQLDLAQCVAFVEHDEPATTATRNPGWDRLLERYHNARFDDSWGELPLWRLVVIVGPAQPAQFIACFFYLHAICDGNSGPAFHRALLAELQATSQQERQHDAPRIVRSPDAPPLPSIEALHRLPTSPCYLLKMLWQDTCPGNSKNVWLGGPIVAKPTTPSRFCSMTLPADVTSKLVSASRSHAASLTATVHALIGTAIMANLPEEEATRKTRLKSGIAVSLRRFLPRDVVTPDSMGNWVCIAYYDAGPSLTSPPTTTTISWQDARAIKKMLDDEIRREGKNTPMGCLRYAGNMHKFFEDRVKRPRDGSYLLSNLGVFKPRDDDTPATTTNDINGHANNSSEKKNDGDTARSQAAATGPNRARNNTNNWTTGRMIFSEGFDAAGEAIQVTMITGCDGCLTVGFVWNDAVVEETLLVGIFDTLEKLMIETAQQDTTATA